MTIKSQYLQTTLPMIRLTLVKPIKALNILEIIVYKCRTNILQTI